MPVLIAGNTYGHRVALRHMGGRRSPEQRGWIMPDAKAEKARALVDGDAAAKSVLALGAGEFLITRPENHAITKLVVGAAVYLTASGQWAYVLARVRNLDDDGDYNITARCRLATSAEAVALDAQRAQHVRRMEAKARLRTAWFLAVSRNAVHDLVEKPGAKWLQGASIELESTLRDMAYGRGSDTLYADLKAGRVVALSHSGRFGYVEEDEATLNALIADIDLVSGKAS